MARGVHRRLERKSLPVLRRVGAVLGVPGLGGAMGAKLHLLRRTCKPRPRPREGDWLAYCISPGFGRSWALGCRGAHVPAYDLPTLSPRPARTPAVAPPS